jgi:flagellar assembly protein FliH
MTQPRIHRFDFNGLRDFRGPIAINATLPEIQEPVEAPPPEPVFTLAELDAARMAGKKEGYSEGFAAGQLEAKKQSDANAEQANVVIHSIADVVHAAQADYRHILGTEAAHIHALTLAVAKKVAGEALDARGEQTIEAIIARCLPVMFTKPRLMVDLHPDMFQRAADRIESQIRAYGFEGELQFRTNEALSPSDVTLAWGTGEMHRSTAVLWQELESLIERIPLELTFADTLATQNTSTGE